MEINQKFKELYDWIGENDVDTEAFNKAIDTFLDDLLDVDFFGTEGQCDPRCDWRDK